MNENHRENIHEMKLECLCDLYDHINHDQVFTKGKVYSLMLDNYDNVKTYSITDDMGVERVFDFEFIIMHFNPHFE